MKVAKFLFNNAFQNNLRKSTRKMAMVAREALSTISHPELTTLNNGFRVVSENNGRASATVSFNNRCKFKVGIWIDAGSRHETEGNNGVANFLERMFYRGTRRFSQTELENQLENIGARLSSYTSRDNTALFAECASKDVEKVVAIIADVLRNSKLHDAIVERERLLLMNYMEEIEENSKDVVFDYLYQTAFQGTPFSKSVLGPSRNIQRLSANDMREFMKNNYKPIRMSLTGVGGVDHSHLVALTEKYFGDMDNTYPGKIPTDGKMRFTGSEVQSIKGKLWEKMRTFSKCCADHCGYLNCSDFTREMIEGNSLLYRNDLIPFMFGAIAVEGVELGHKDALPLRVAIKHIGQWDRTFGCGLDAPSRFVQKISAHTGLHQVVPFSFNHRSCGLFGIYFVHAGDDLLNVLPLMKAFQKEWKYLSVSVTEDEVERAKNMLKTEVFVDLESNTSRADNLGRQVLCLGEAKSLTDIEREIEMVNAKMVRNAMNDHIYDRDTACAGVGRTEAFPPYSFVRMGMSWWRL